MSQSSPCWHALPPDEVLRELESSSEGLYEPEWRRRLAHYGPNRFRRTPPASVWRILVSQIRNVVVGLLVAAATVALLTGDVLDAAAIGAVLLLNVAIGFTTELRAHRAMEALVALEVARARVLRAGLWREVDARDLVPGDVIHLEAGQAIPADARLLEASELRVVEASLTGEPAPAEKRADLGSRRTYRCPTESRWSTRRRPWRPGAAGRRWSRPGWPRRWVASGRSPARWRTARTPLERRLDALGRRLALLALAVAALVALLGYWTRGSRRGADPDGDRPRCRGGAGRSAGRRHDRDGGRRTPHGAPPRAGAAAAGGRDARLGDA